MTDQPHYPYADGDIAVLGPEVFASADGQTISWKGANYSRHPGEIHCLCGGISVTHEIRGAAEPQDAHGGAQAAQGGAGFPDVQGRCPACGGQSLMLADGGYITCRRLDCPDPEAAHKAIDETAPSHDAGPSVAECAKADRVWPLQKEGE